MELDKGQVYGDYVILGYGFIVPIENYLKESRRLLGYWYFKDTTLIDKFYEDFYEDGSFCGICCTKKSLDTSRMYTLDEELYTNETWEFIGEKKEETIDINKINTYIRKRNFLFNKHLYIYSKQEISDRVNRYIKSKDFLHNSNELKEYFFHIFKTFYVENTCIEPRVFPEYTISLIKVKDKYGFLLLEEITMLRLDNKPIPMVELFISNILGKRFVVDCTEYKDKIPKYFRVIRDIENIEDIFESYLKSLAYCKNMT